MSAEAEGTAPSAQPAGLSGTSGTSGLATALARVENWHHDVVAQVDGWGWIRSLNDWLTAGRIVRAAGRVIRRRPRHIPAMLREIGRTARDELVRAISCRRSGPARPAPRSAPARP